MSSFVYLIAAHNGSPVKIGVSKDVKKRHAMLQTGFPYHLSIVKKWAVPVEYALFLERIAHHALQEHRLKGEWFSCPSELAKNTIDEIMLKSKKGQDLEAYEDAIIAKVRSEGAIASASKKKLFSKRACRKIKDRWPLPNKIWPTYMLLKEAGISLNTVKATLGPRPIAQYNYQAKLKRKARKLGDFGYRKDITLKEAAKIWPTKHK